MSDFIQFKTNHGTSGCVRAPSSASPGRRPARARCALSMARSTTSPASPKELLDVLRATFTSKVT
jgi:hypothetical protein